MPAATLGTIALKLAPYVLPPLIQGVTQIGSQLIGKSQSGNNSAIGNQSETTSNQSTTATENTQSGYQSTTSGQVGSVGSIGSLLSGATSTPTGNNWEAAFNTSQESAQTANQLQTGQWNLAQGLGLISNIMTNMANMGSQVSARAYNRQEAATQRAWQEHMAGTAYQRTMEDMKKAGLNPILAAFNGATNAGSGANASTSAGNFTPFTSAAVPNAHTANAQAMYDYGNNTMQFLNNAMATINTAKQFGYSNMASGLTQSMYQVADSSAKSIQEYASQTGNYAEQHLGRQSKKEIPGGGRGR